MRRYIAGGPARAQTRRPCMARTTRLAPTARYSR